MLSFALLLHAHQPVGNFDHVIEETYQTAYLPFLEAAGRRPWLRLNLHFSGFLLDWIGERHPEYMGQLQALAAEGRLEMLGGGYFEPILPILLPEDQAEQIRRLRARLEHYFGHAPKGFWLAERVWEPSLPAALAAAGVGYTLLDDTHFQLAGCAEEELHGYWLTEDQGARVAVLPSNFFLRLAIPFRPESESLDYLLGGAQRYPGSLLTMGDDLEKFGAWPHTFEHVVRGGWLERFFDGLERHGEQIQTVRIGDYLDQHAPRGLIYLPSASYPEMMQWALPHAAAGSNPQETRSGAPWRGFLAKYREANLLHKTQLDLSRRVRAAGSPEPALTHLLAAQCNDAYWHGWFGGLYAPHLRNNAFAALIAADRQIDPGGVAEKPLPQRFDLDCDGFDEVELRSETLRALFAPADGGCLEELDHRLSNANLINSLQRRPEIYHEAIRQKLATNPAQLPGSPAGAGGELETAIQYDLYPRSCGRVLLCPPGKTFADYQAQQLDADPGAAGGVYAIHDLRAGQVELRHAGGVEKIYRMAGSELQLRVRLAGPAARQPVLEMVFNLLAPTASDRGFEQEQRRFPLTFAGPLPPQPLALADGWRGFRIELDAPGALAWWVYPLYSVSQSETGFESVYQGSAIGAVWAPGTLELEMAVRLGELFPPKLPL